MRFQAAESGINQKYLDKLGVSIKSLNTNRFKCAKERARFMLLEKALSTYLAQPLVRGPLTGHRAWQEVSLIGHCTRGEDILRPFNWHKIAGSNSQDTVSLTQTHKIQSNSS